MITEEKLLCGTLEELSGYFSFVGVKEGTRWPNGANFEAQIHVDKKINNSNFRLIFHIEQVGESISFIKNWIFIRE